MKNLREAGGMSTFWCTACVQQPFLSAACWNLLDFSLEDVSDAPARQAAQLVPTTVVDVGNVIHNFRCPAFIYCPLLSVSSWSQVISDISDLK